jgi:hypothetical protein
MAGIITAAIVVGIEAPAVEARCGFNVRGVSASVIILLSGCL